MRKGAGATTLAELGEKAFGNLINWKEVDKGGHFAAWEQPTVEARQGSGKESRECFLEWRPHAGGPGRRLWGAESPRAVHRHRRRSVNELDSGDHFAAWQEADLFTTEIRAAFRSLR